MIHHVTREVDPSVVEPCVGFYGLLGFTQVAAPPSLAPRAIWLQRGPTQLHLLRSPGAAPAAGHIAVVLDDYEATTAQLTHAGHDVEPRRQHWGSPRAYVRDPAGNLVELMAGPPS